MQRFLTQPASQTTRPPAEKGQGLVELAILIPVLVIIIIGALDLGRIFFGVITVTNVSREGARYLTLHPDDRLYVDVDPEANPVCYDLDITPPEPKPEYFCTIYAAEQEAKVTLWQPLVDPAQIDITPNCPDTEASVLGCDRRSDATVTAVYCFKPMILLFANDPSGECADGEIRISRTTKMMVP